jgi:hypothetical protein
LSLTNIPTGNHRLHENPLMNILTHYVNRTHVHDDCAQLHTTAQTCRTPHSHARCVATRPRTRGVYPACPVCHAGTCLPHHDQLAQATSRVTHARDSTLATLHVTHSRSTQPARDHAMPGNPHTHARLRIQDPLTC